MPAAGGFNTMNVLCRVDVLRSAIILCLCVAGSAVAVAANKGAPQGIATDAESGSVIVSAAQAATLCTTTAPYSRQADELGSETSPIRPLNTAVRISGRVVTPSSAPIADVIITVERRVGNWTRELVASTVTNGAGEYVVSGLAAGYNYFVTPQKDVHIFSPASRPLPEVFDDVTDVDFIGVISSGVITGHVRTAAGAAMPGVCILIDTFSGIINPFDPDPPSAEPPPATPSAVTIFTDEHGFYTSGPLTVGRTYTVTPSSPGYTFQPMRHTFFSLSSGVTTGDFIAVVAATSFTVSGFVRKADTGEAVPGVTMEISGALTGSTRTNTFGAYRFDGIPAGATVRLSPVNLHNAVAQPPQLTFSGVASDIIGADFLLEEARPSLAWTGEPGYTDDGVDPDIGASTTAFTFRVRYTDPNGDAPAAGYPQLHLLKDGVPLPGSPFTMSSTETFFAHGVIFCWRGSLEPGDDYSYFFEAYDQWGSTAIGVHGSPVSGPTVTAAETPVYTISGRIRTDAGVGLNGVSVTVSGTVHRTTVTEGDGTYVVRELPAGAYTIVPSLDGFTFDPPQREYLALDRDLTGQNFSAFPVTAISGSTRISGGASGYIRRSHRESVVIAAVPLESGTMVLSCYTLHGRVVYRETVHCRAHRTCTVSWNGTARDGSPLAAGIYIIHLHGCGITLRSAVALVP